MQVASRLLRRRGEGLIHVLSGLRGSGKTRLAHDILNKLESQGETVRYLCLEEPEFGSVRNGCDLFLLLKRLFESATEPVFLALDEPCAVPSAAAALGSLAADGRFELLIVSSTESIFSAEERSYFGERINQEELLPVEGSRRRPFAEILVRDVFTAPGIPEIGLVGRVIEYLATTVGDVHTQRGMASFVERDRAISKNTVADCVAALVNAHVVRAVPRFNLFEGCLSRKGGWKYGFTDPELRRTNFGRLSPSAESFDESVVRLARQGEVCWVGDVPGVVDFVTRTGGRVNGYWRATPEGPVAVTDMETLFRLKT